MCLSFGWGGVGGASGDWEEAWNRVWRGGVMSVSPDYLCRWHVQVSVYCDLRIPAHVMCTQCSILLHLMDICFLTCICL